MKKAFCLFALPFIALMGRDICAQKYIGNSGVTVLYADWYDSKSERIRTASEMGIQGTPMLSDNWVRGTLHYYSGTALTAERMNFSLYDNRVYYAQDDRVFQIILPVASVDMELVNESGEKIPYHLKSGFPAIDEHDGFSLYEVLYEGNNLQLLQWNRKKVEESFNYGSVHEKNFTLKQQLYVYIARDKSMIPIKRTLASIRKALPGYAAAINAYTGTHPINTDNPSALSAMFAYIDQHK